MCLKIIIAALAVAAVNGRPQLGSLFLPNFQAQQYLVSPEGVIVREFRIPPPDLNNVFLNAESRSSKERNRNPENINNPNVIPNRTNDGGSSTTNLKNNQQNSFQESQNTEANIRKRGPQKLVQTDGVKTNRDKSPQESPPNSSNDQGHPTTTNVIDKTQTKVFTNEYVPVSKENVEPNVERQNKGFENINTKTNNPEEQTNTRRSNDKTDQNRKTVSENESVSNGRSDNSSANDRPVLANPPSTPRSRPEERTGDSGAKTDDDDRWVWGYEEMSTPAVDDRANFDGSSCPNDQVRVGDKCVPRD